MNTLDIPLMKQWLDKIAPLFSEKDVQCVRDFEQLLEEKQQTTVPEITVYGVYSHGKSTLINALLGEEAAQVGICPTTAEVHRYLWRGFYLLDTPGIDAPVAHQQVANSQLSKSELVLFVLHSDSVDEQSPWEKMVRFAADGQKIILVINDFCGARREVRIEVSLKDRYRENLQNEAQRQGVEGILEKIPIRVVNVKSALRGRLENKRNLISASGIDELEPLMLEHLRSFGVDDVQTTLRRHFLELISLCEAGLCDDSNGELLKEGERSLDGIRDTRKMTGSKILKRLDALLDERTPELRTCIEEARTESEASAGLASVMESLLPPLKEAIQSEMTRAQQNIETICTNFDKLSSVSIHGIALDNVDNKESSLIDYAMKLPWSQMLTGLKWEPLMQTSIVKLLSMAKEWLPALFKGVGPKTMSKWASGVASAAGPLLCVGGAVYEYYQSYKEEQAQRNVAARKAQTISDTVTSVKNRVRSVFAEQLDCILDEAFSPVEQALKQDLALLKQHVMRNDTAKIILVKARNAFENE